MVAGHRLALLLAGRCACIVGISALDLLHTRSGIVSSAEVAAGHRWGPRAMGTMLLRHIHAAWHYSYLQGSSNRRDSCPCTRRYHPKWHTSLQGSHSGLRYATSSTPIASAESIASFVLLPAMLYLPRKIRFTHCTSVPGSQA